MTTSSHRSGRHPADRRFVITRGRARRAVGAAAAALCLVTVAACGDDDDSPDSPESPAPTGANEAPVGNVDVTMSIADPDVVASNVDAPNSQAPAGS